MLTYLLAYLNFIHFSSSFSDATVQKCYRRARRFKKLYRLAKPSTIHNFVTSLLSAIAAAHLYVWDNLPSNLLRGYQLTTLGTCVIYAEIFCTSVLTFPPAFFPCNVVIITVHFYTQMQQYLLRIKKN